MTFEGELVAAERHGIKYDPRCAGLNVSPLSGLSFSAAHTHGSRRGHVAPSGAYFFLRPHVGLFMPFVGLGFGFFFDYTYAAGD
jgi:hypothetical protein